MQKGETGQFLVGVMVANSARKREKSPRPAACGDF